MKGLLLKDFYMAMKYCRAYALIAVAFAFLSAFNGNAFYIYYPMILASNIPVTLISYDERSKWQIYADTMPCSRKSVVAGKYLMMLICLAAIITLEGIAMAVYTLRSGTFAEAEFVQIAGLLLLVGILPPCLMLPIIFKFGAEKGRLMYYLTIGFAFAVIYIYQSAVKSSGSMAAVGSVLGWIAPVLALLALAVSWAISVRVYEKREL